VFTVDHQWAIFGVDCGTYVARRGLYGRPPEVCRYPSVPGLVAQGIEQPPPKRWVARSNRAEAAHDQRGRTGPGWRAWCGGRAAGTPAALVGIDQKVMDLFSSRRRAITAKTKTLVAAFEAQFRRAPNSLELDRLQRSATFATRHAKAHLVGYAFRAATMRRPWLWRRADAEPDDLVLHLQADRPRVGVRPPGMRLVGCLPFDLEPFSPRSAPRTG
jgi:hypothetical protein